MAVERIIYTGTPLDNNYLDISCEEIIQIHKKLFRSYETKLKRYGVTPPWDKKMSQLTEQHEKGEISDADLLLHINAKEYQLIFLFKYRRKLVHKDLLSAFVRKHISDAALDQQVRHLGTQMHWNVLNRGASIPDEDEKVPSAYYYLVSIDQPNPTLLFDELKRKGRLAAKDFEELKIVYNNCCATCGRKEGSLDERFNNVEIVLQQGHMDPSKELNLTNTIPQCQYCNQTYRDDFCFNEYGRVVAVYNPYVVLKSPKPIQDEMITILTEERKKK